MSLIFAILIVAAFAGVAFMCYREGTCPDCKSRDTFVYNRESMGCRACGGRYYN